MSNVNILYTCFISSLILEIVAIMALIINWKRIPTGVRFLGYFIGVNLFIELLSFALAELKISNYFLHRVHALPEFILLNLFFFSILAFREGQKKIVTGIVLLLATLIGLLAFGIIDTGNESGVFTGLSVHQLVVNLAILIYSGVFFGQYMFGKINFEDKVMDIAMFWIVSGMLLYYAGTVIYHLTFKYLMNYSGESIIYVSILNLILLNVFLTFSNIGLWKFRKSLAM